MTRKRSWAVAASAACVLLAGCGAESAGQDGTSDSDTSSAEPTGELTFASWQWQEPRRGEELWEAITGYESTNSDASLGALFIPRAQYENTLQTQLGAGGGPDIFLVSDSLFPELADAGLLEPLDDDVISEAAVELNQTNEAGVWEGEQLAITWEVVNYALFWNQEILDEAGVDPPATPEELVTAAQDITEATGVTGFAVRHQMNEELPWWVDFANWPYGFGGGWSDGDSLTIDSPENVEALEAFKAVHDSGAFATGDDASTFRSRFAEGQVAMMIDNSATVDTLVHENDTVPSEAVGAAALPFPTEASAHVGTLIGINPNSENKELAKDWMRWLLTEEAQEAVQAGLGVSTVAADVEPPEEVIEASPWLPPFQAQSENSRNPLIPGFELETGQIRPIVLDQVARVVSQGADPAEALQQAQQEAERLVGG